MHIMGKRYALWLNSFYSLRANGSKGNNDGMYMSDSVILC